MTKRTGRILLISGLLAVVFGIVGTLLPYVGAFATASQTIQMANLFGGDPGFQALALSTIARTLVQSALWGGTLIAAGIVTLLLGSRES